MYCIHCGQSMPEQSVYCPSCGKAQTTDGAPPPVKVKPGLSRGALVAIILAVLFIPGVALLGILAAIAIPAYQDYTQRAHMAEALYQAAPVKLAYSEYVIEHHEPPGSLEELGLDFQPKPPLAHLDIREGLLVLQFDASLKNDTLALSPWLDSEGAVVVWQCGRASPPQAGPSHMQQLSSAFAAEYTSLPVRILPAACR